MVKVKTVKIIWAKTSFSFFIYRKKRKRPNSNVWNGKDYMSSFRQGKLGNQPLWKSFLMGTDPCNDLVCPAEKREEGGREPNLFVLQTHQRRIGTRQPCLGRRARPATRKIRDCIREGGKDWTMVNNGGTPSGEVFFL